MLDEQEWGMTFNGRVANKLGWLCFYRGPDDDFGVGSVWNVVPIPEDHEKSRIGLPNFEGDDRAWIEHVWPRIDYYYSSKNKEVVAQRILYTSFLAEEDRGKSICQAFLNIREEE